MEGLELWGAHVRTCTRERICQYLDPHVLQVSTTCSLFPDPTWVPRCAVSLLSQPPGGAGDGDEVSPPLVSAILAPKVKVAELTSASP